MFYWKMLQAKRKRHRAQKQERKATAYLEASIEQIAKSIRTRDELSKTRTNLRKIAEDYKHLGDLLALVAPQGSIHTNYLAAIEALKKTKTWCDEDYAQALINYQLIVECFIKENDFKSAYDYLIMAIECAENIKFKNDEQHRTLAVCYFELYKMQMLYFHQEHLKDFLEQAIKATHAIKDYNYGDCNRLGICWYSLAEIYRDDPITALAHYKTALKIFNKLYRKDKQKCVYQAHCVEKIAALQRATAHPNPMTSRLFLATQTHTSHQLHKEQPTCSGRL